MRRARLGAEAMTTPDPSGPPAQGTAPALADHGAPAQTGWAHFEHRADIGVRGVGPTLEAAFEQAALALTAVVAPLDRVRPRDHIGLGCEAADDESLLVAWLNALVYEMAVRRMLFSRFHVRIHGHHLHADAWGELLSVARHRPAVEVKGATFTALRVAPQGGGGWLAQTVVDV